VRPSHYNRSTLDAEHNAQYFAGAGRVGIVTRFGLFYGADAAQSREMISYARRRMALLPGPEDAYISSVTRDDAAAAVVALLDAPSGIYNVVDNEPLTHRQFIDALADALRVAPLKLPPRWLTPVFGSPGEMLARSLRISNRKLRETTGWTPSYPSAREGWREIVREMPAP
jgi:nucleoside-diphosphate-sugar epimerase